MSAQVIVVGGGLSGLSAAHTLLEHGSNVVVLDKSTFFGGNSTKATSGINGALTRTQIALGIQDSADLFAADTTRSARDLARPELIKVLAGNSASAVHWLQDKFKLDLSLVSRLGGHSQPRTHRGKEMFPGMTITYALMEMLEDIAKEQPDRCRIIMKARANKLIVDGDAVVGVQYEKGGETFSEYGPVVLATGGYAADFTETSLLKKYRPDIYELPTTNGDHCTGDGHKMVLAIGGKAIDLEKVQVHPTGLVDPKEPNSKIKFLAAEALRGVGGLLLNGEGKRFCDELGHRDYVTGEIWKTKGPIRLVLNGKATKEIEWHCKHYVGRGLMKKFSGEQLAKEIGVPVSQLESTFNEYNEIGTGKKKDPYGKKFFHNLPVQVNDTFHVALMSPVLHYTMGGVEVSPDAEVCNEKGVLIPGLFASGEIAGGVHGANRLGGSSLLGCVVFGRVAGDSAARYLLQQLSSTQTAGRRLGQIAGQLSPYEARLSVDPLSQQVNLTVSWAQGGSAPVMTSSAPSTPAPSAPPPAEPSTAKAEAAAPKVLKDYTADDVAKHNSEQDCWVIVNGQVLDVTKFLPDHPGGKKAILLYAGRDATEEFNMLHNKNVIEKYSPESVIGTLKN